MDMKVLFRNVQMKCWRIVHLSKLGHPISRTCLLKGGYIAGVLLAQVLQVFAQIRNAPDEYILSQQKINGLCPLSPHNFVGVDDGSFEADAAIAAVFGGVGFVFDHAADTGAETAGHVVFEGGKAGGVLFGGDVGDMCHHGMGTTGEDGGVVREGVFGNEFCDKSAVSHTAVIGGDVEG